MSKVKKVFFEKADSEVYHGTMVFQHYNDSRTEVSWFEDGRFRIENNSTDNQADYVLEVIKLINKFKGKAEDCIITLQELIEKHINGDKY